MYWVVLAWVDTYLCGNFLFYNYFSQSVFVFGCCFSLSPKKLFCCWYNKGLIRILICIHFLSARRALTTHTAEGVALKGSFIYHAWWRSPAGRDMSLCVTETKRRCLCMCVEAWPVQLLSSSPCHLWTEDFQSPIQVWNTLEANSLSVHIFPPLRISLEPCRTFFTICFYLSFHSSIKNKAFFSSHNYS